MIGHQQDGVPEWALRGRFASPDTADTAKERAAARRMGRTRATRISAPHAANSAAKRPDLDGRWSAVPYPTASGPRVPPASLRRPVNGGSVGRVQQRGKLDTWLCAVPSLFRLTPLSTGKRHQPVNSEIPAQRYSDRYRHEAQKFELYFDI